MVFFMQFKGRGSIYVSKYGSNGMDWYGKFSRDVFKGMGRVMDLGLKTGASMREPLIKNRPASNGTV